MTKNDFQVGHLHLTMPFDSVRQYLGSPDSSKNFGAEWSRFTADYYKGVIVWTNEEDNSVWTIDVYDPVLSTPRGLRIGDSLNVIDKLYRTSSVNIFKDQFGRVGPYDFSFKNYNEHRLYDYVPNENVGWVMILFTKDKILTKMLFYVGIPE